MTTMATSKIGQIAAIRGDASTLLRMIDTGDSHTMHDEEQLDIEPGSEATGPECVPGITPTWLTQPEITDLYGSSRSGLSSRRAHIRRNGTNGKALSLLNHADVIRLYASRSMRYPLPKPNRSRARLMQWRERIDRAVQILQAQQIQTDQPTVPAKTAIVLPGVPYPPAEVSMDAASIRQAIADAEALPQAPQPTSPLVSFAEAMVDEAAERQDDAVWRIVGRMAQQALDASR